MNISAPFIQRPIATALLMVGLLVAGLVAYPFNRAQRLEFQGGVTQVSFDQITRTQAFSPSTGILFQDDTQETPFGDTLTLATSSAAIVYDTASYGATSPILGRTLVDTARISCLLASVS